MKQFLAIGFLFLFLVGCKNYKTEKPVSDFNTSFEVQSKVIGLDSTLLDHYERGFALYQKYPSLFYVAYNRYSHTIDWFDLATESVFSQTNLYLHGPNQISEQIYGIYVQSKDSVFLNDGVYLYVMNIEGVVKYKRENVFKTELGPVTLVNSADSPLGFIKKSNSIIGEAMIMGSNPPKDFICFLEVNIVTGDFKIHQSPVPKCHGNIALNNWINVHFNDHLILYTSTCSSDIFVYDLEKNETQIFSGKSSLSKNKMASISTDQPEALWRHYIENPRFFKVIYSPGENLYYRMHWKESAYQIDGSKYTTAYDKNIILSVFDDNFNIVSETLLPTNQYLVGFLVPGYDGILLNANHPQNENYEIDEKVLHELRFVK